MSERLILAWRRWDARFQAERAIGLLPAHVRHRPKRYLERSHDAPPAVYWGDKDKGKGSIAYVNGRGCFSAGLRYVGGVVPELGRSSWGGRWNFNSNEDRLGWYTNNEGESWKDGAGLVWGVVLALPGKRTLARVVPGFQVGGVDWGPIVDFSTIYEVAPAGDLESLRGECRHVARIADKMAEDFADEEREYQRQQQETNDDGEDESGDDGAD